MTRLFTVHPFFFTIFPILSLYVHNMAFTTIDNTIVPLLIAVLSVIILLSILYFILRDKRKAGLIVSLCVLLFFSYGHLHHLTKGFNVVVGGIDIGPHNVVLSSCILLLALGAYFSIKTRIDLYNITKILNIASFFLVAIPLFNIGMNQFKTGTTGQYKLNEEYFKVSQAGSRLQREYPNIYYIVLDAYARADVLEDIYKYDNTELINYLTQKGFYVAGMSRSNYCQTALSLASSLNYTYLNDLAESVGIDNASRQPLTKMIRGNRVFHFLKQYGYRTVIFDASGWDVVAMKNADIIYNTPGWGLNGFHNVLVNTTPLFYVLGRTSVLSTAMQYDYHRRKILYAFDKLREVGNQEGPLFVYAHILVPHQPFVFGANGEQVVPDTDSFSIWYTVQMGRKREAYVEEYTKQLAFVNKMVKEAIDSIISKSSVPPVIILQADHGPASMLNTEDSDKTNIKERMSILNAYYFPGNDYEHLYESITPVNTFRIIFNQFFETQYELLKDESFFSTWSQPYRFIDVTGKFHTER